MYKQPKITAKDLLKVLMMFENNGYDLSKMDIRYQDGNLENDNSILANNISLDEDEDIVLVNMTESDIEMLKKEKPDSVTEVAFHNGDERLDIVEDIIEKLSKNRKGK